MAIQRAYRRPEQCAELLEHFNDSNKRETEFCQRLDINVLTSRERALP